MKRALLISLAMALLGLAVWGIYRGALSCSGYCFEKGRYLTEREIINAAVMKAMSYQKAFREEQRSKESRSYQTDLRSWSNLFILDNPNCCRINPKGGYKPTFRQRLLGEISYVVDVAGMEDNPYASEKWQPRISNCGKAWSRW